MNTSANFTTTAHDWKQEVHRRLAAHKSRRHGLAAEPERAAEAPHPAAGSLAAQAAARVAARYAQVPSYSQVQAAEAHAAVRAAEIATRVAREAQANARAVIAGIESAAHRPQPSVPLAPPPAQPSVPPDLPPPAAASISSPPPPTLLEPQTEPQPAPFIPEPRLAATVPDPVEDWWRSPFPGSDPLGAEKLVRLHAALPEMPIHANLIEFPRAVPSVHKRHAKPDTERQAPDCDAQLSIFEVDPISAEQPPTPSLSSPWSGIQLEDDPADQLEDEPAALAEPSAIGLAPLGRRLLAAVVDGALITGACLAAAFVAATHMDHLPTLRALEFGALPALFAIGLFYQALFFTFADATPGMRYARVSLCALDGHFPTRAQLHGRLGALLLSLLPLGLGLAWAIFDEDHLTWHDRLSRTYQRKCEV